MSLNGFIPVSVSTRHHIPPTYVLETACPDQQGNKAELTTLATAVSTADRTGTLLTVAAGTATATTAAELAHWRRLAVALVNRWWRNAIRRRTPKIITAVATVLCRRKNMVKNKSKCCFQTVRLEWVLVW